MAIFITITADTEAEAVRFGQDLEELTHSSHMAVAQLLENIAEQLQGYGPHENEGRLRIDHYC